MTPRQSIPQRHASRISDALIIGPHGCVQQRFVLDPLCVSSAQDTTMPSRTSTKPPVPSGSGVPPPTQAPCTCPPNLFSCRVGVAEGAWRQQLPHKCAADRCGHTSTRSPAYGGTANRMASAPRQACVVLTADSELWPSKAAQETQVLRKRRHEVCVIERVKCKQNVRQWSRRQLQDGGHGQIKLQCKRDV